MEIARISGDPALAATVDIVTAFVANTISDGVDIPALISDVYAAITSLGAPAAPPAEEHIPVVSARASVKPDVVTCMCCGYKGKTLKRHIMAQHGLTEQEYKARFGLPADHPLIAPNYAERRREIALQTGLGIKGGRPRKAK